MLDYATYQFSIPEYTISQFHIMRTPQTYTLHCAFAYIFYIRGGKAVHRHPYSICNNYTTHNSLKTLKPYVQLISVNVVSNKLKIYPHALQLSIV